MCQILDTGKAMSRGSAPPSGCLQLRSLSKSLRSKKIPQGPSSAYRDFVEKAIGQRLENPLKNLYGGAILAGQIFIIKLWQFIEEPRT